jgi:spermidine/putrescine transport system ATP-binding protein
MTNPEIQYDVELVNITKEFAGGVTAVDDISLQIEHGEFFALLGPSGCGKTTTLRMIAGFEFPTSGQILIQGQPVQNIPAFQRPVNTVFQDYALFPHMTAMQNVMFGLRKEGKSRDEARQLARDALEKVQLPAIADRKPGELSGGQQQRVALARALVKNPKVLLLDESLSALDHQLRLEMRHELKDMQRDLDITFVFVTHDQEEAITMADRIAVMNQGKVLQVGSPEHIYEEPRTRFAANFIGDTNFLSGVVVAKKDEMAEVLLKSGDVVGAVLDDPETPIDSVVTVAVRPEKITIMPTRGKIRRSASTEIYIAEIIKFAEEDTDSYSISGVVKRAVYMGTDTHYTVEVGESGVEMVVRTPNFRRSFDTRFHVGQNVYLYWMNENARILID